jgi:hypothetical protein
VVGWTPDPWQARLPPSVIEVMAHGTYQEHTIKGPAFSSVPSRLILAAETCKAIRHYSAASARMLVSWFCRPTSTSPLGELNEVEDTAGA